MAQATLSAVTNVDKTNLATACDYCGRYAARAPLSTEQHRARVRDSLRRKWHRLMLMPTVL